MPVLGYPAIVTIGVICKQAIGFNYHNCGNCDGSDSQHPGVMTDKSVSHLVTVRLPDPVRDYLLTDHTSLAGAIISHLDNWSDLGSVKEGRFLKMWCTSCNMAYD